MIRYAIARQRKGFQEGTGLSILFLIFGIKHPFLLTRFLWQKLHFVFIHVFHCTPLEDGSVYHALDPLYS